MESGRPRRELGCHGEKVSEEQECENHKGFQKERKLGPFIKYLIYFNTLRLHFLNFRVFEKEKREAMEVMEMEEEGNVKNGKKETILLNVL